jgi:hypothetical protein
LQVLYVWLQEQKSLSDGSFRYFCSKKSGSARVLGPNEWWRQQQQQMLQM